MSGIKRKLSEKEKVRYFSIKLEIWNLRILNHYFLPAPPIVIVLQIYAQLKDVPTLSEVICSCCLFDVISSIFPIL